MAPWSEAQVWIRPRSQPSLIISHAYFTDNFPRYRLPVSDFCRALATGSKCRLVRRLRRRRLTDNLRPARRRHAFEQSHDGFGGGFHDHVVSAHDSDYPAGREFGHSRRREIKSATTATPAGSAASGSAAATAKRSGAGSIRAEDTGEEVM